MIKITIEGPVGVGKSKVFRLIEPILTQAGYVVYMSDNITEAAIEEISQTKDIVVIHEKQNFGA
jgi:ABC-type cobalamin/Fe3+-siderophores transport system ATPase subunit